MKIHNKCTATLIDSMGDDLRVVNAARVSFDKWSDEFQERDAACGPCSPMLTGGVRW